MFRNCLNFPIKNRLGRFFSCNKIRSLDKSYFFFNQKCFKCLFRSFQSSIQIYNNQLWFKLTTIINTQIYNNQLWFKLTTISNTQIYNNQLWFKLTTIINTNLQQPIVIQTCNRCIKHESTPISVRAGLLPSLNCFLFFCKTIY